MKPVIKKQTHYSLLLMRDDTHARTLRVSNTKLRFFLTSFFLLIAFGAAGTAGGIHYWKKYRALQERYETQEKDVSEMRLHLERLKNFESLLAASGGTVPQARNEEVGVSTPPVWTQVAANGSGNRSAQESAPASTTSSERANTPATNGAASTSPRDANAGSTPESTASTPSTGAAAATTTPAASGTNATAPAGNSAVGTAETGRAGNAFLPIDSSESPLRISNFNSRVTGQQRIRVSYGLSTANEDGNKVIAGKVAYSAIMKDGKIVELTSLDSSGARFSITRMKLMQTTVRIPQGYKSDDLKTLEIVVQLNDGARFEESFEL